MATTASVVSTRVAAATLYERAELQHERMKKRGFSINNFLFYVTSILIADDELAAYIRQQLDSVRDFLLTPYHRDKTKLTEEERATADTLLRQTDPSLLRNIDDEKRHAILREISIIIHPSFLALSTAMQTNEPNAVNEILKENIEIMTSLFKRSILDIAVDLHYPNILECLLKYAKEKEPEKLERAFYYIDYKEKTTLLSRAIHNASQKTSAGFTPDQAECHQMVKLLLKFGADPSKHSLMPPLSVAFNNPMGFDVAITLLQHEAKLDSTDVNLVPALVYAWRERERLPGVKERIQALSLDELQLETELAYQTEIDSLYVRDTKNEEEEDEIYNDEIYNIALRKSGMADLLNGMAEQEPFDPSTWWPFPHLIEGAEANNLILTIQNAIKQHLVLPIMQRAVLKEPYASLVNCFKHSGTYPEIALNLITEYSHGSYRPSLNLGLFTLHKNRFKQMREEQLRFEQILQKIQNSLNETNRVLNEADDLLYRIKNGFAPN